MKREYFFKKPIYLISLICCLLKCEFSLADEDANSFVADVRKIIEEVIPETQSKIRNALSPVGSENCYNRLNPDDLLSDETQKLIVQLGNKLNFKFNSPILGESEQIRDLVHDLRASATVGFAFVYVNSGDDHTKLLVMKRLSFIEGENNWPLIPILKSMEDIQKKIMLIRLIADGNYPL